jgi:integrase
LIDVAHALSAYIQDGRPVSSYRTIFLRHRAPFEPFAPENNLTENIRGALKRAGLAARPGRRGIYLFRHTLARAAVLGTALHLLYLAGLRAGELLRLTQADLDLDTGTLHIRHSKFNKSRLVPLAPDLVQRIVQCRVAAAERYGPSRPDRPLFPSPHGDRYSITALRSAFHDALKIAGIKRTTDSRIRLHDLRHSFAGLRLLLWCEQNVDLGAKLPLLAAYLGHVGLASSQRYLQLTRDLMGEITRRHQARFGYLIKEESRR